MCKKSVVSDWALFSLLRSEVEWSLCLSQDFYSYIEVFSSEMMVQETKMPRENHLYVPSVSELANFLMLGSAPVVKWLEAL